VDRDTALAILGLAPTADLGAVKRRFRTLVQDLHPDRGGDPRAFDDVQAAYRLLCRELDGVARPVRPRVARGRPSRSLPDSPPVMQPRSSAQPIEPLTSHDLRELLAVGDRRFDADLLAGLLLAEAGVGQQPASRTYRFVPRAPGTRGLLGIGLGASLTVRVRTSGVRIELSARGRRARRQLTALDASRVQRASWTRHRGDAVTVAATDLSWTEHSETGARIVAAAVVEVLDTLGWPLELWRIDPDAHRTVRS